MWLDALFWFMLVVCAVTDLWKRRLYNAVIFPCMAAAFAGRMWESGWEGLLYTAGGFAVGFGLLLVPYLAGGIGAGDVKLLAAVGALKGASFVLSTAVYMGLIGFGLALFYLSFHKEARERVRRTFAGFAYTMHARSMGIRAAWPAGDLAAGGFLPYGVAIGGGAVFAWLWGGLLG